MLSVDADIADSVDLLGKVASDLQEDVAIADNKVTGTSGYVEGYTGFSSNPAQQEGNYLALHFEDELSHAAKLTVELVGGTSGETTLDSDGICVFRLNDAAASAAGLTSIILKAYNSDNELMDSLTLDISEYVAR